MFVTLFPNEASEVLQHRPTGDFDKVLEVVTTQDFFGAEYLSEPRSAGLYLAGRDARHGDDVNEATGRGVDDVLNRLAAELGEVSAGSCWPQAYDATTLLLDAIEGTSRIEDGVLVVDRAALRDHLSAVEGFEGLTGTLACDAFGDCGAARMAVYQHLDPANPDAVAGNVVFALSR